ncbi:hypothetical protein E3T55_08260 [Cryobacterium frigoriphilum]|uniref:Peptidase M11 gametolysin domain-containing protein n=1 Tax=Cryobacterium frigoriphilum TaxID=1259150 RepID=A0A4R9A298_9MICO|nr:cell wall-binding repeat-containing protein [Cryobacterium frigoriphilum]TFD50782.1 hypothetical protein E3T55_08260 [Cryobacterium frigoriphilum]
MLLRNFRGRGIVVGTALALCALVVGIAGPAGAVTPQPEPVPALSLENDTFTPGELAEQTGGSAQRRSAPEDFAVSGYAQAQHSIDIAVVVPAGSAAGTTISDAAISSLVSSTGSYWQAQSNNQVTGLTANPTTLRYSSSLNCDDVVQIWQEAAAAFGRANVFYYVSNQARHLMVLVPEGCGATGIGSVGSSAAAVNGSNGGLIWVSQSGAVTRDIVAHEFGHNLGLQHSNAHVCPSATTFEGEIDPSTGQFSDGCVDDEYGDAYDVMGIALTVNGQANSQLTALNVTHKTRLDALSAGEVQNVAVPTGQRTLQTTATLTTTGASAGLRALKITDPETGRIYYVDFRGGGGTDAGSLYERGLLTTIGVDSGVRVLALRDDGTSVVFQPPAASASDRTTYLVAGDTISTRLGAVTVTVLAISGTSASVRVTLSDPVERLSGIDRFTTAVAVSQAGFPGTAPIVYLATGADYPDALSAAPAAALGSGPLLLTNLDSLPTAVRTEIQRLQPQRIVVVGGRGVISAAVESQLAALAPVVDRLSGVDRYETARLVVDDAFGPVAHAYVATGRNFPDALAAAAAAGAAANPVILVDGNAGSVDAATAGLVARLGVQNVTIAGGAAVVSSGIATSLTNAGIRVSRQGGSDRFETALLVNQAAFGSASEVFLATGEQFPDALAGAALAGQRGAPLYIVPQACVPNAVGADFTRLGSTHVTLIGGTGALSAAVGVLARCG